MFSPLWQRVLFAPRPAAPAATTWDPANSSTDWTLSGGNLTALRTSTAAGFWALLRGSTAKSSGTVLMTIDAIGGGSFRYVGLDTGVETQNLGLDAGGGSVGYASNGDIRYANGATPGSPFASWTTGDVIKIIRSGANVSFYKNNVLQTTVDTSSAFYGPVTGMSGATYPAVSNGNATGMQVTLDASGW